MGFDAGEKGVVVIVIVSVMPVGFGLLSMVVLCDDGIFRM